MAKTTPRAQIANHSILRDKFNWIVRHPKGCNGARSAGRIETYFYQPQSVLWELEHCCKAVLSEQERGAIRTLSTTLRVAVMASLLLLGSFPALAQEGYDPSKEKLYVQIVLTEAAGESMRNQLAVAYVLRNRGWRLKGFAGLARPDLREFIERQPIKVREACRQVVLDAKRGGNDPVGGATHFENVRAFGKPQWAKSMSEVCTIGQHTFYKEKKGELKKRVEVGK